MAVIVNTTEVNVVCSGDNNGAIAVTSISGLDGPYTFVWIRNGQFYSNDRNIYFLQAGTYVLYVTGTSSGTPFTAQKTIVVTQPNPIIPIFTITSVVCHGGTGTIAATGNGGTQPYSYLWDTGETTSSIEKVSGTYSLTMTDANGCTGTGTIFLPDAAPITIEIEQTLQECYLGEVTLTANIRGGTTPYFKLWLLPDGSEDTHLSIQAEPGNTYKIGVSDANGCQAARSIYVPLQTEQWYCCLGKRYADQATLRIKGVETSQCENDKSTLLYLCIKAYERFDRDCLTDEQKNKIIGYINSLCCCTCNEQAESQEAEPFLE